MVIIVLVAAAALLAFANGANDNFKGVATLLGSGTTNYRGALAWATVTTFGGGAIAFALAETLLARFGGTGLVPDATAADPQFATSVACGAGLAVILATRLGLPISTTHALVGAMSGGALASAVPVQWGTLAKTFLGPLLLSPFVALALTLILYPLLRRGRSWLGIERRSCVCVGPEVISLAPVPSPARAAASVVAVPSRLSAMVGTQSICRERYAGQLLGLEAGRTLDFLHFVSAGLVSLARGLNDAPKIAAVLLVVPSFNGPLALVLCGVLIALGGLVAARRVADNMSHRITAMNAGQGLTANLITGLLVICASRWGLPVSTTHVSCGALFGIGMANRRGNWPFVGQVLVAWFTTLPISLALGWLIYQVLGRLTES